MVYRHPYIRSVIATRFAQSQRILFYSCAAPLAISLFFCCMCSSNEPTLKAAENVGKKGEEVLLFEESFEDLLSEGWSWIREQPARWCIRDRSLQIHVRPGFADTVENALVRPVPPRDGRRFAFEVTVTNLSQPVQQWEQAGLTWYSDGRPAMKLVKELVDGRIIIIPGEHPVEGESVQLRLEVSGQQYTAYYRTRMGEPFSMAASGNLPDAQREEISIQCYHGPEDQEHWIRFDDFRIWQLPNEK